MFVILTSNWLILVGEKYNVLPAFYYSVATNFYKNITGGVPMDGNKTQWQEYNKIVEYQLTELLSAYPQVMEIWFDGGLIPPAQGKSFIQIS